MATIQSSVQTFNETSSVLRKITGSVNITADAFQRLETIMGGHGFASGLRESREQLASMNIQFEQTEEKICQVRSRQEEFSKSIEKSEKKAKGLKDVWGKISSALEKVGINTQPEKIFKQGNSILEAGNSIQAKTGMEGDKLDMAKESMKTLYTDKISGSYGEAASSLSEVNQITGQTGAGLEQITRAGLLLKDTFGYGIADSIGAAGELEKQFGLSGAEAFDMIVQGAQQGLDKNGEMLSVIKEYSSDFRRLGLGPEEMFNMLANGARSGEDSIGTLGNAIKSFSEQAVKGGAEAEAGFAALGLNAEQMKAAFQSGGEEARSAFRQTMEALNSMENPMERNAAGSNLFGGAWEEMDKEGFKALENPNGSVEISAEHLEELNRVKYDDAASAFEELVRTVNTGTASIAAHISEHMTGKIRDFTAGLQGRTAEIQGVFGMIGLAIGTIGKAISDNWSVIEPILWGIIAALVVYNATAGISWLTTLKDAAALTLKTVCSAAQTAATIALTIAQSGLNAAMAAFPLTWIIMMVIALIAVFYSVIAAINKFTGTSYSATGILCSVFAVAGAIIANSLMGLLELGIGVIEYFYNIWAAFADFFGNLFHDPVASVIHLFADMADAVLGVLQKIAQSLDLVFGSNLSKRVEGWRSDLESFANKMADKLGNGTYEDKHKKADFQKLLEEKGLSLNRLEYGESAKKGYDFGANASDNMKGKFDDLKNIFGGQKPMEDPYYPNEVNHQNRDEITGNVANIAGNTAAMADNMDVMDEDLKYLRDAAEQEIINRFTLAELKVDVNNNNTLKTQTDFDDVNRMLGNATKEILSAAAEGGHF